MLVLHGIMRAKLFCATDTWQALAYVIGSAHEVPRHSCHLSERAT